MDLTSFIVFVSTLQVAYSRNIESSDFNLTSLGARDLDLTPHHYYMNELCYKKKILHKRDALLVSPWRNNLPPPTTECVLGIDGHTVGPNFQFVITFKEMNLYRKTLNVCHASRLDLYDGTTTQTSGLISDASGLCGTKTGKVSYETQNNFLTMDYKTINLPSQLPQYFVAVITPFHYGHCNEADEFKCSNGKCIKDNMICDSYNNCGDDSDELACIIGLTIAAIIGIVIGCLVFVAIVTTIIVCCCCCGWCAVFNYQKI